MPDDYHGEERRAADYGRLVTTLEWVQRGLAELKQDLAFRHGELRSEIQSVTRSIEKDLEGMKRTATEREHLLENRFKTLNDVYVTKEEFKPIRLLFYGFMTLLGAAFVTALLNLVVKQ